MERYILYVLGILCLLAAIFNWNWWFESRRVKLIIRLLSRTGARILYLVLGIALLVLANI